MSGNELAAGAHDSSIRLVHTARSGRQLTDAEWLHGLRTLKLQSDVTYDVVVSLAASPQVENLEELSIPNLEINARTARCERGIPSSRCRQNDPPSLRH